MVINDESDHNACNDASDEHAAKREEVADAGPILWGPILWVPIVAGPIPGRGLIGRLNVMICHRSAGDVGRHVGGRPRAVSSRAMSSARIRGLDAGRTRISGTFRSARKIPRPGVAYDTRAGPARTAYWAGHHRGTRNRKPAVSTARMASATISHKPLIRLSATVPKATRAATAYMPSTALRWVWPISRSR